MYLSTKNSQNITRGFSGISLQKGHREIQTITKEMRGNAMKQGKLWVEIPEQYSSYLDEYDEILKEFGY